MRWIVEWAGGTIIKKGGGGGVQLAIFHFVKIYLTIYWIKLIQDFCFISNSCLDIFGNAYFESQSGVIFLQGKLNPT